MATSRDDASATTVEHRRTSSRAYAVVGYLVPVAWILLLLAAADHLSPVARLLGATVGLLFSIKVAATLVLRGRGVEYAPTPFERLLFWTVWPGVRPDRLCDRDAVPEPDARNFLEGYVFLLAGAVLAAGALAAVPIVGVDRASWLGLFAALCVVHFGVGNLLPFGLRWLGFPAPSLFDTPVASRSVGAFWSRRWNLPFVRMNRFFLTRPLAPRIGIGAAAAVAFVCSGVLHELAISYPAGGGWGLPFFYFLIQAAAYAAEAAFFPPNEDARWNPLRRIWVWAVVLGPLPLLFHGPFRLTFLAPPLSYGHDLLASYPVSSSLGVALWIGAAGHALVLVASSQVPGQLEWEEDLRSLRPLNRKLLWTYGAFIVLVIASFGILTAVFHGEFVDGNPVAVGLAATIATFWLARIGVDALYFSHDDWPDGLLFDVGHALLTSLFVLLVGVYGGTVLYHVL